MSEKIVQFNEEIIKGQLKELVRGSVEETLNELLEKDKTSWVSFFQWLRGRSLDGAKLIFGDKCLHLLGDGRLGEVVLLCRLRKAAQPHHGLEVFELSQHFPTPFS